MAKRKKEKDVSVDFEVLIQESEIFMKPKLPSISSNNLVMKLLPLKFMNEISEPTASSSNFNEAPSKVQYKNNNATIVPSEPGVAASLTSELDIKQEKIEDENDTIYFEDSMPEVKKEPYDDELGMNCEEEEQETSVNNEEKSTAEFKQMKWTLDSSSMRSLLFKKKQGFLIEMPTEPYDIFRLFLNDELLDLIVKCSNKNAKNYNLWVTLTHRELMIFIGLLMHTGTIQLQRISDYWNTHYLFDIKSFSRFMKFERFMQLLGHLSFSTNTTAKICRRQTIQSVVDHFNEKMHSIYYPGANLIVAKSIEIRNKQIVLKDENRPKQKESRDGALRVSTVHMLADQTGIVLKLNVTPSPLKFYPFTVVSDLLVEKFNHGHSVYLPQLYCSLYTVLTLLDLETHCTGPLLTTDECEQHITKSLQEIVTQEDLIGSKNGSYFCDGIHLCRINKDFYVSSQYDDELLHLPTTKGGLKSTQKLITMYESVMEVDLEKDLWEFYPLRDTEMSWPRKVFIHVLQLAMLNAHKFYNTVFKLNMSFYDFRLEVLEKMLPILEAKFDEPNKHNIVKIDMHRMEARKGDDGRLYRCKVPMKKQCKGCYLHQKKIVMTSFECRSCPGHPGFCAPCFLRCHKQESVCEGLSEEMPETPNVHVD